MTVFPVAYISAQKRILYFKNCAGRLIAIMYSGSLHKNMALWLSESLVSPFLVQEIVRIDIPICAIGVKCCDNHVRCVYQVCNLSSGFVQLCVLIG